MAIKLTAINNMTDAKDDSLLITSDSILSRPGTVMPTNMVVTEQSPTAMGVRVAPGRIFVQNAGWTEGSSQPRYHQVKIDINTNRALNNNPSANSWIAAICVKVDVGALAPGAQGELAGTLEVVYGTAAVTPVAPAIPNNHELIAHVTYNSSHAVITNARITDMRRNIVIAPHALPTATGLINGRINVVVASNNITVSVVTTAGLTPTAQNPVGIVLGGTMRLITSALSVTANAGTNWFSSGSTQFATFERDYFVYIGFDLLDGVLVGFAPVPYAQAYSDFSTTSTNNRFCRISTITNATGTDAYTVVGRFAATLSAAAGHNWSVPAFTPVNLVQQPVYTTRSFLTYNPGFVGFASLSTDIGRYTIENAKLFLFLWARGTSNSASFSCVSPFTRPVLAGGTAYGGMRGENNGTSGTIPRMWQINENTATVTFFPDFGGGVWVASGSKGVEGLYITHEIGS